MNKIVHLRKISGREGSLLYNVHFTWKNEWEKVMQIYVSEISSLLERGEGDASNAVFSHLSVHEVEVLSR